jgi:hypothetical protein
MQVVQWLVPNVGILNSLRETYLSTISLLSPVCETFLVIISQVTFIRLHLLLSLMTLVIDYSYAIRDCVNKIWLLLFIVSITRCNLFTKINSLIALYIQVNTLKVSAHLRLNLRHFIGFKCQGSLGSLGLKIHIRR